MYTQNQLVKISSYVRITSQNYISSDTPFRRYLEDKKDKTENVATRPCVQISRITIGTQHITSHFTL